MMSVLWMNLFFHWLLVYSTMCTYIMLLIFLFVCFLQIDETDEARKKFSNAKSISSAQYFGDQTKSGDIEAKASLQKFSVCFHSIRSLFLKIHFSIFLSLLSLFNEKMHYFYMVVRFTVFPNWNCGNFPSWFVKMVYIMVSFNNQLFLVHIFDAWCILFDLTSNTKLSGLVNFVYFVAVSNAWYSREWNRVTFEVMTSSNFSTFPFLQY